MPVAYHRWDVAALAFILGRPGFFFETGRCWATSRHFLQQPDDDVGVCGAPSLFATHVLGHVLLAEECRRFMLGNGDNSGNTSGNANSGGSSADAGDLRALGRVVWTGSRASSAPMLRWETIEPPSAPGQPSGYEAFRQAGKHHTETYGQAKRCQDLVNVALSKRLAPVPCAVICPGAVDSEMMPGLFKPFIPAFFACRAYLRGFNVKAIRGAHALIALATAPHATIDPTIKYTTFAGDLEPSKAGVWELAVEDQERVYSIVQRWLLLWRQHAAKEMGGAQNGAGATS